MPAVGQEVNSLFWDNSLDGEASAFSVYTQLHSLGSSFDGNWPATEFVLLWLSLYIEHVHENRKIHVMVFSL